MSDRPRALGVLNGSGGMAIGFEQAGFEILGALEADDMYGASFRLNRPELPHVVGVENWVVEELEKLYPGISDDLALFFGHPPCQGVSGMNSVAGEDNPKNKFLPLAAETGMQLGATHIVLENIPRMLSLGRRYVEQVRDVSKRYGYTFSYHRHFVGHFGVSQKRRRVMFIMSKRGHELDLPTEPYDRAPVVWDVISDLDEVPAQEEYGVAVEYAGPPKTEWQDALRNPDGVTWNHHLMALPDRFQKIKQGAMWTSLPVEDMTEKEVAKIEKGNFYNAVELVRMREDRVGPTITGSKNRMHPRQCRRITAREASRLMGFPDAWKWAIEDNFQQIAAGVCPPVCWWLGQVIMSDVGGGQLPIPEGVLF